MQKGGSHCWLINGTEHAGFHVHEERPASATVVPGCWSCHLWASRALSTKVYVTPSWGSKLEDTGTDTRPGCSCRCCKSHHACLLGDKRGSGLSSVDGRFVNPKSWLHWHWHPGEQFKHTHILTNSDCLEARPGEENFSTRARVLKPNLWMGSLESSGGKSVSTSPSSSAMWRQ